MFKCDGLYVSLVNAPGNVRQPVATAKLPDPVEQGPTENGSIDIPPGFQALTNSGIISCYFFTETASDAFALAAVALLHIHLGSWVLLRCLRLGCTAGIFTVRLPNACEPSKNGTSAHSNSVRAAPAQRPSSSIATLQKPKNFAPVPPAKRVNGIAYAAVPTQRVASVTKVPQPNGVAVRQNTEQSGAVDMRPNTEKNGLVQRTVAPQRCTSPATSVQPLVVALQHLKKSSSVGQNVAATQKSREVNSQQQSVQSTTLPEDTSKHEVSQSQVCHSDIVMVFSYSADKGRDGMGVHRTSGI